MLKFNGKLLDFKNKLAKFIYVLFTKLNIFLYISKTQIENKIIEKHLNGIKYKIPRSKFDNHHSRPLQENLQNIIRKNQR